MRVLELDSIPRPFRSIAALRLGSVLQRVKPSALREPPVELLERVVNILSTRAAVLDRSNIRGTVHSEEERIQWEKNHKLVSAPIDPVDPVGLAKLLGVFPDRSLRLRSDSLVLLRDVPKRADWLRCLRSMTINDFRIQPDWTGMVLENLEELFVYSRIWLGKIGELYPTLERLSFVHAPYSYTLRISPAEFVEIARSKTLRCIHLHGIQLKQDADFATLEFDGGATRPFPRLKSMTLENVDADMHAWFFSLASDTLDRFVLQSGYVPKYFPRKRENHTVVEIPVWEDDDYSISGLSRTILDSIEKRIQKFSISRIGVTPSLETALSASFTRSFHSTPVRNVNLALERKADTAYHEALCEIHVSVRGVQRSEYCGDESLLRAEDVATANVQWTLGVKGCDDVIGVLARRIQRPRYIRAVVDLLDRIPNLKTLILRGDDSAHIALEAIKHCPNLSSVECRGQSAGPVDYKGILVALLHRPVRCHIYGLKLLMYEILKLHPEGFPH